jgi:leader peptidase (prepilin peptidase) / N-methyltransferase
MILSPAMLSPSSRRNLIAAAGGAVVGAGAAAIAVGALREPGQIVASAVLCAAMAAITLEDTLRLRVPDPWVYGALGSGLVWGVAARIRAGEGAIGAGVAVLIAIAVCGGAFWAVREVFFRLRGVDGLGLGDVKIAAAGGAWLGWEGFAFAVLVAAAGALAFVATRVVRGHGWSAGERLAFGAFLAPAVWATWLVVQKAAVS